ncbi:MAG: hypothetical protein B6244_00905 [Candidatus Cloacimonetes bacterium 4572_55]|nr:MAG: hypothetical protein B6244_00905 [Candidatus Cloacimonetes bacterium 4572_55]
MKKVPSVLFLFFIILLYPLAGQIQAENAPDSAQSENPDSTKSSQLMGLDELNGIAMLQVRGSRVILSRQDILDGIVYQRVVVESDTEKATVMLDGFTGEVRMMVLEQKDIPDPEQSEKDSLEIQSKKMDPQEISRKDAERIAHSKIRGESRLVRMRKIERDGRVYYEAVVRPASFGGEDTIYWIDSITGAVDYADNDPRKQVRDQQQDRLVERLGYRIKIPDAEARKKALEKVPGRIISSKLKKKSGDLYYYFDIFTADKEIKKVRVHTRKDRVTTLR